MYRNNANSDVVVFVERLAGRYDACDSATGVLLQLVVDDRRQAYCQGWSFRRCERVFCMSVYEFVRVRSSVAPGYQRLVEHVVEEVQVLTACPIHGQGPGSDVAAAGARGSTFVDPTKVRRTY